MSLGIVLLSEVFGTSGPGPLIGGTLAGLVALLIPTIMPAVAS